MRLEMCHHLRDRYGDRFQVFSAGWPFPAGRKLTHDEEAALYRGAKIAIGISQFDLKRYTSDRLFRAMGSGACYLTKEYPNRWQDFSDGDLRTWEDFDELDKWIDFLLDGNDDNQFEREEVARRGCEYVHRKHTWLDRAKELQKMIGWHEWM
jgi:spore maturation protein CgeB